MCCIALRMAQHEFTFIHTHKACVHVQFTLSWIDQLLYLDVLNRRKPKAFDAHDFRSVNLNLLII